MSTRRPVRSAAVLLTFALVSGSAWIVAKPSPQATVTELPARLSGKKLEAWQVTWASRDEYYFLTNSVLGSYNVNTKAFTDLNHPGWTHKWAPWAFVSPRASHVMLKVGPGHWNLLALREGMPKVMDFKAVEFAGWFREGFVVMASKRAKVPYMHTLYRQTSNLSQPFLPEPFKQNNRVRRQIIDLGDDYFATSFEPSGNVYPTMQGHPLKRSRGSINLGQLLTLSEDLGIEARIWSPPAGKFKQVLTKIGFARPSPRACYLYLVNFKTREKLELRSFPVSTHGLAVLRSIPDRLAGHLFLDGRNYLIDVPQEAVDRVL